MNIHICKKEIANKSNQIMKTLTVICITFILFSCAQIIDTPPLAYDEIHTVENKTQTEICSEVRDWVALNFGDSNEVLKVVDLSQGVIIGRGASSVNTYTNNVPVEFVFDIRCKNNKIKIVITDFIMKYPSQYIGNIYYPPHDFRLHDSTYVAHQSTFAKSFKFIERLLDHLTSEDKKDTW